MAGRRRAGRRAARGTDERGDIEQAVCEATERLLATRSLAELSVAEILRAAGVSRGSFYFYFPSKHAVLAALVTRVNDDVFAATQTWLHRAPDEPLDRALRAAMRAALDDWRLHAPVMRAVAESWHDDPDLEAAWRSLMGRFTNASAEQIDREREAGVAPPGIDAHALGAMLTWMTERALYLAISGEEPEIGDEQLVETLTHVWLRAVYAGAPGT